MEQTHTIKFKIWVVKWPRNLVKQHDRRQSDDDDDGDDDKDDVTSKHVVAIKYYQFGNEVQNVVHLFCLQHYGITYLMFFSLYSCYPTFSRPVV
jgi:hypothetical protein